MKYLRTKKTYKASNMRLLLDIENGKIEAYSYDWWCFVKIINGKLVFNDYNYSVSTSRHQRKVRDILEADGIKIDVFVKTHDHLNRHCWRDSAVSILKREILELEKAIAKKGSRKAKNAERFRRILDINTEIGKIEEL